MFACLPQGKVIYLLSIKPTTQPHKMGITQKTPESEINEYIQERMEYITDAFIRFMHYIGERCLNAARKSDSYKDQTGNLRSSIGYVIVVDGKIKYQSNFEVVKKGYEGEKSGSQFVKKIARQFPEGIVLIVVAGMNYASYVSAKGYDVLESAELLADKLVPDILKKLGFNK